MPADPASAPPLAIIADRYPDFMAPHVAHLLKLLEARGHACTVWSLHRPTALGGHPAHAEVGAAINQLPESLSANPFRAVGPMIRALFAGGFLPALLRWCRTLLRAPGPAAFRALGQACVLHAEAPPQTHFFLALGLSHPGAVAQLAARLRNGGWAVLAEEPELWTLPEAERAERLSSAAFCLAPSDAAAALLRRYAPGAARLAVAAPSVDLGTFKPPMQHDSLRTGESADSAVHLVSIGRLETAQGYRDLLAALADMPKATHWRLTLIGDGSLAEKLRQFAQSLRLSHHIVWRAACDQAGILKALRDADIYVQSPKVVKGDAGRSALPHALVEAASQCLPIVSTRHPSLTGFLANETSALLVRGGHIPALTEAIHRLCRDPGERVRLGHAAREQVEAAHSLAAMADDLSRRLKAAMA
jgi:glycosyltransferase involved in cell wall biosynthesis